MVADLHRRSIDAIREFLRGWTKRELLQMALTRKLLLAPVLNLDDLAESRQLASRDVRQSVPDDPTPGARYPAPSQLIDGVRPTIRRAAPRLGEHDRAIYVDELVVTAREYERLRAQGVVGE